MRPDSDKAPVDGFGAVANSQQVQHGIGVLPDNKRLHPRLTAREHLRYYGRLHGMKGETLEKSIDEMIDTLVMGDVADRQTKGC